MSSAEQELHQQAGPAPVAELAGRRAYEQAWRQFAQGRTPEEFCRGWLLIQCHLIGGVSDAVVVLLKPGTQSFAPVAFYPEAPRERILVKAAWPGVSRKVIFRPACSIW